jgi:hypothetical protein
MTSAILETTVATYDSREEAEADWSALLPGGPEAASGEGHEPYTKPFFKLCVCSSCTTGRAADPAGQRGERGERRTPRHLVLVDGRHEPGPARRDRLGERGLGSKRRDGFLEAFVGRRSSSSARACSLPRGVPGRAQDRNGGEPRAGLGAGPGVVTLRAEGVGFEPTVPKGHNGFRDRPIRPLSHPSSGHYVLRA